MKSTILTIYNKVSPYIAGPETDGDTDDTQLERAEGEYERLG